MLCVLIISLFSCQTTKTIEGIYSEKKNLNRFEFFADSTFIYQSLLFYSSSFVNTYSDGTWLQTNNNTIILNSRIKNNIVPIRLKKEKSDNPIISVCENLSITQTRKKDPNLEYTTRDYCVFPYINGKNYLDSHPYLSDDPLTIDLKELIGLGTNTSGKYSINIPPVKRGNYCLSLNEPVDSICFEIEKRPERFESTPFVRTYYRLKTETVKIYPQSNIFIFDIALNDSLFSYRIFDNEVLKFKGSKLIFKDSEKNNKTSKLQLKNKSK